MCWWVFGGGGLGGLVGRALFFGFVFFGGGGGGGLWGWFGFFFVFFCGGCGGGLGGGRWGGFCSPRSPLHSQR